MRSQTEEDHRHGLKRRPESIARSKILAGWYEEFSDCLVCYLAKSTRSIHDAQDIAQEAFVHLMLAQVCGPIQNPKALLFTTALNLLKDNSRRTHTHVMREAAQIEEIEIPDSCDPSQVIESEQALAQVVETLRQLRPSTRKAFLLNRVELLSQAQIAAKLGITKSMVEKHMGYAMTAFEAGGFAQPRHVMAKRSEVVRASMQPTRRPTTTDSKARRVPAMRRRQVTPGMWRWDKRTIARHLAMVRGQTAVDKGFSGYGRPNAGLSGL